MWPSVRSICHCRPWRPVPLGGVSRLPRGPGPPPAHAAAVGAPAFRWEAARPRSRSDGPRGPARPLGGSGGAPNGRARPSCSLCCWMLLLSSLELTPMLKPVCRKAGPAQAPVDENRQLGRTARSSHGVCVLSWFWKVPGPRDLQRRGARLCSPAPASPTQRRRPVCPARLHGTLLRSVSS